MENLMVNPTSFTTAGKTNSAALENDCSAARLPVNLSSVIFSFFENELYILLVKNEPGKALTLWSLPSRMLHHSEDLSSAASDMLNDLTNQKNSSTELLGVGVERSVNNEQILSVSYFSCVRIEEQKTYRLRAHHAKWHKIDRLGPLDFNQLGPVNNAKIHLQYNATLRPFCFDFLPEYFTVPQIQKVYEAIFRTTFDRRNFSKKILATGLLLDSGFKVDLVVTNKAKLYRLDKDKYKREFCQLSNFVHSDARQFSFL